MDDVWDDFKMDKISQRLGLGTMRMNFKNKAEAIKTINTALKSGIKMINTGEFYNAGETELVLREALVDIPREDYIISLKYSALPDLDGKYYGIDSDIRNIRAHLKYSLVRLGLDYVDIFEPARIDENVNLEDLMGELVKLLDEGYIKHISLSEVSPEVLRQANAIHHIDFIEMRYSLINRGIEEEMLSVARELGIKVIVYGLNGGGKLEEMLPHENLRQLKKIADSKNITVAALGYAWALNKNKDIMCLTGCTKEEHLKEIIDVLDLELTEKEIKEIEKSFEGVDIYNKQMLKNRIVDGKYV